MADFFDKLKQELDKGITTISVKAKETIETTKIKGQISKLKEDKRKSLEEMGNIVYSMILEENFDIEKIIAQFNVIKDLDNQIQKLEEELKELQEKAQKEIESLKTTEIAKSTNKCECGAEIPPGAKFCVKCGKKLIPD